MKKRILTLGIVLAVLVALVIPMAALAADHQGEQTASTGMSAAISIVGKSADTPITTITFPEGMPGTRQNTPFNDVDLAADPQVLDVAVSEPVVRLKNTSGGELTVTLKIATWSGGVVVAEDYELVVTTDTTVEVVATELSGDGATATVATGIPIPTLEYKALYLAVDLGGPGKSGVSQLTILGES